MDHRSGEGGSVKPRPEIGDAIWVISDRTHNDVYVTAVQVGPDTTIVLDRDRAVRYGMTVITAVQYAEYDAAVFAQAKDTGMDDRTAAQMVMDLRADRPPLDDDATAPLRFDPILAFKTKEAAVHVSLQGELFSQWTAADANGHAMHVLQVASAVDLDGAYRRYLFGTVGLDAARAAMLVDDLGHYRSENTY